MAYVNLHAFAEIAVKGNGNNIPDGQFFPTALNWTHMGTLDFMPNNTFIERTFSIKNIGTSLLFLGNISAPVIPASGGVVGYTIVQQPAPILGPGQATPIKVRFQPFWSTTGLITAQIDIPNSDANENPFSFNLGATVIKSEMVVEGNGHEISDDDSYPSVTDHTDFGDVLVGSFLDRTFVIRNTNSSSALHLYLPMSVSEPHYTVIQQPASDLNPGQSTTFTVRFTPTDANTVESGDVIIFNSDLDEATYNFEVKGKGAGPEIEFRGTNGVQLPDGFNPPTGISGTDFGAIPAGTFKEHTFSNL